MDRTMKDRPKVFYLREENEKKDMKSKEKPKMKIGCWKIHRGLIFHNCFCYLFLTTVVKT